MKASKRYIAALYVRIKGRPTVRASIQILPVDNAFHLKRIADEGVTNGTRR